MKITKILACVLTAVLLPLGMLPPAIAEDTAAKVGKYITFGHYEQDNDLENGPEPIEWQVLDIEDGRMLVISRYSLELMQYHHTIEIDSSLTWETCDLRAWLNGEFMETAFSEEERARIPTVTVEAYGMHRHTSNPGNDTEDQLFILNVMELFHYFPKTKDRKCQPTPYAVAQYDATGKTYYSAYLREFHEGHWNWWLRTPGEFDGSMMYVQGHGHYADFSLMHLYNNRIEVDFDYGVRPAMWIELNP